MMEIETGKLVINAISGVFGKNIQPGIARKKLVEKRQKEVDDLIGDFNRAGYRNLLNKEIRDAFYRLVDKKETKNDVNLLKSVPFGTKQWSDESYNMRKSDSLCPHGCVYCLDGETFILMDDMSEKKLKEINIGDRIIGIERNENKDTNYKLVTTEVIAKTTTYQDAYKVILEDGTEIICSGDHRWLVRHRGWKYTTGRTSYPKGDLVVRPHLTTNNLIMKTHDSFQHFEGGENFKLGYLSGMIHGDGTLGTSRVKEVIPLNKKIKMIDIQTTTGNFIANGCVSHNCYILPIINKNFQMVDIGTFMKDALVLKTFISDRDERDAKMPCIEIDWNKVMKGWAKGNPKLIMTPTSHDVVPKIVDAFIVACLNMLDAGHSLLITTKPRVYCVEKMCKAFLDYKKGIYKDRVTFRFTMTTCDQDVKDCWEWLAPTFDEGIKCLDIANDLGFETSISMEPFLKDPVTTVEKLKEHVTGEIWIGMMNGYPSEKVLNMPLPSFLVKDIKRLKEEEYTFDNINQIVSNLRENTNVHWKESIINMYLKERGY